MRRVASQCGVSATAIYRHFEDKDALVCAAVLEGFRLFGSYLLRALEEKSPLARLEQMGRRYFDFAQEHPQAYRILFMLDCKAQGMEKLDDSQRREVQGTFQLLEDRVSECQRAGVVRAGEPRALAAFVWSSYHGLVTILLGERLGVLAEEARASLVDQQLALTLRAVAS